MLCYKHQSYCQASHIHIPTCTHVVSTQRQTIQLTTIQPIGVITQWLLSRFLPVHYHSSNYGKATMVCDHSSMSSFPPWCQWGWYSCWPEEASIYEVLAQIGTVRWNRGEPSRRQLRVLAGSCEPPSSQHHISWSMAEYQAIHLTTPVNGWHFPFIKAVRWNVGL